jgi:hypothetical protein
MVNISKKKFPQFKYIWYICHMDKSYALKQLADGNATKAAELLNVTRRTISNWPDKLTKPQELMVLGALVKLGKRKI